MKSTTAIGIAAAILNTISEILHAVHLRTKPGLSILFFVSLLCIQQVSGQTYYLRSDVTEPLDWSNGSHWTTTLNGTTPVNSVPTNSIDVVLTRQVMVNVNNQAASSTTIESTGILIIGENSGTPTTGHDFGTVSGTGTLRIVSEDATAPTFPGGTWTSFLSSSGGTVEYSGDGNYTLPAQNSYNHLTVTGSTTSTIKTLPTVNLDLAGNLSVLELSSSLAATLNATSGSRTLNIAGSIICDGVIDFDISAGNELDITFDGTGNDSISGNGFVELHRLTLNKSAISDTLTIEVSSFNIGDTGSSSSSTSIDLGTGLLEIATDATITISSSGNFDIPGTAGIYLNSSGLLIQMTGSGGGDLNLSGSINISSGVFSVSGDDTNNNPSNLFYSGLSSSMTISGGSLEVKGALKPVDGTDDVLAYQQSGGVVSLARNTVTSELRMGTAARAADADFAINDSRSTFMMSGGILEVVRARGGDGKVISIINTTVPDVNITGGEVRVAQNSSDGDISNTPGSTVSAISEIAIYSVAPFWNLSIGDGDFTGQVGGANLPDNGSIATADFRVLNNFLLNIEDADGGGEGELHFFHVGETTASNEDGFDLEVHGNLTLTNGTLLTTDDDLSGFVEIQGSGNQTLNSGNQRLENVVIEKATGGITLSADLSIENMTISDFPGNLDMGGFNISISGNWTNNDGDDLYTLTNAGDFNFNSGAAQTISGDNSFGPLTIATGTTLNVGADTLYTTGNITEIGTGEFSGINATLVVSGSSNLMASSPITVANLVLDMTSGGLILDNDPQAITFTNLNIITGIYDGANANIPGDLTLGSSGVLDFTGITTIDVDGDFDNSSTLDLNASGVTAFNLGGGFLNDGTFTAPSSFIFDGTSTQTLSSDLALTHCTKSGGGTLNLNANLSVSGQLTLTNGIIASSTTHLLTLGSAASISGGNASSHVSTAMAQTIASTTTTSKTFPLGDGTNYRPISLTLTQSSASETTYTTTIVAGPPPTRTNPVGIAKVSNIRYYTVTQSPANTLSSTAGANVASITYGTDDLVSDESFLKIAKDDGSAWADLGRNLSVGSNANAGTISSTLDFNTLGDFVLASELDAVLPVEYRYFRINGFEDGVTLLWATNQEIQNDYFQVQQSTDGIDFQDVGKVDGHGDSKELVHYKFKVMHPPLGVSYYRLKQVDLDGKENFSAIALANWFPGNTIKVYPNPVQDKLHLPSWVTNSSSFQLYNSNGSLVMAGQLIEPSIDFEFLATGTYHLIINGQKEIFKSLIIKR